MNIALDKNLITQEHPAIHVRTNLDFKYEHINNRYWYENNVIKTRIFDAILFTFPEGEKYFITSVRAFRDQIIEPELSQKVTDFIKQEAQHGIAHDKLNQHIKDQGMPVEKMRARLNKLLSSMLHNRSKKYNLAFTAASEHITAIMAETFYSYKSTLQNIDPQYRAILAWHAIEEMEHRDVAFDVMKDIANVKYPTRAIAMLEVLVRVSILDIFLIDTLVKADGFSFKERVQLYFEGIRFSFGKNGVFNPMIKLTLHWFKPNFHPNNYPIIDQYPVWIDTLNKTNDPIAAGNAFWMAGK